MSGSERSADSALRRRRGVTGVTAAAGMSLLGASLAAPPGSSRFYRQTLGVAGIWTGGALASGPVHLGTTTGTTTESAATDSAATRPRRPVLVPVLLGVGAFAVFYLGARVAKHIPLLNRAIASILGFAQHGSPGKILFTTLANGAAEEVFFRGAVYDAVGGRHPVAVSTALYSLSTVVTRNPSLVLASAIVGTLFGLQRQASGGVLAPMLTHVVWSALMLRFLPPLFPTPDPD
jgi:hypothetical protein